MEKHENDKITALSPQLIELIDCNVSLIAHLRATNTIGLADEHHLTSLANKLERSKALLNILCTKTNGYKFLVEGLSKTNQSGALDILTKPIDVTLTLNETDSFPSTHFEQLRISSQSSKNSEIPFFQYVPFQTKEAIELFTGRSKELITLLDSLLPDGGTASITGIGGIGKTELAKMLLYKLDKEYENIFKQIIWINCESSFTASTDFINIAKDYLKVQILGSSGQQRDISSILRDVFEKLRISKSLIILDNVETMEILQIYMPTQTKLGKLSILVTSQTLKPKLNISLLGLDQQDAVEFLKKGLEMSSSLSQYLENGIFELVVRLEMLPLAISQAIGYIKDKREMHKDYTPIDYLLDLDRIPVRLLDKENLFDLSSNRKTIYKTLSLAISKIEECKSSGLLASKILSIVAFMSPDNISSSFVSKLAKNDIDAIEEALLLISRFSIIRFTPDSKKSGVYFSIHRLVQDVLLIRISQNNETENNLRLTMELIQLNLNYDLIDHAIETWRHVTKIKPLLKLYCVFPLSLTNEMHKMGRIPDAYDFSASALSSLKQNFNIEEYSRLIFCLQGYNNFLLGLQGQFDISLENLQKTLNEAKNYLPAGDISIFKMRHYIAFIFHATGQTDKAASICDEMYKDYKFYNNLPLRILYDIGSLQNDIRNFQNALTTAKYILEELKLPSNKNSQLNFLTECLYADIQGGMGNYRESINLYKEILRTHFEKKSSQISNSDRWKIFHNIGIFQFYAGLFDEAHGSYQKALNEMKGQNENECSNILLTKGSIGSLMIARNMLDEALPYCIKVYKLNKLVFGEKNHLALNTLGNIGVCYSKMGRHQDAVEILTQLIENKGFVLDSFDEAQLEKYYLALSLEQIGKLERSIEILNELRLKCLENTNYTLFTINQVDSALKRIQETKTRISVLSTVYKINKLYL